MRLLILIIFLLLGSTTMAQRDPTITTIWNNYSIFNPATSGLEYKHQSAITYRSQWDKVSGAPQSLFANYNTLLGKHHGVGINYTYETIGYSKSQFLQLNYNYQFKIDENRKIALGISPGFYELKISGYWMPPTSSTNIDVNGGVAYKGKTIYTGIGVTHLAELMRKNEGPTAYNLKSHMYVTFRNEFNVFQKSKLYLEGIYRTDFIKSSFDINARLLLYKKLIVGTGYRHDESIMLFGSWDFIERFRLGYAYDISLSPLAYSKGTHEITLGFNLPHRTTPVSISGPDF